MNPNGLDAADISAEELCTLLERIAHKKPELLEALALREKARRVHAQIMGLLVGNPAANAAERLRHLRIEELLAA